MGQAAWTSVLAYYSAGRVGTMFEGWHPMTETVDDKLKDGSPNGDPAGKQTDEELLEAYRKGHQASFTLLVERYRRELFVFLYHFLGDRATAEDVFQEA